jgi:6-phosphogluconolactonase/glucosamine-6-phosphate isomerase/deaminase
VQTEADPPRQLTPTTPVMDTTRQIMVLVAGEEKRGAVQKVLGLGEKLEKPLPAMLM